MKIFPQNNEELQRAISFEDPMGEIEVLKGSRGMKDSMDVLVPPSRMRFITEFMGNDSNWAMEKIENYGR